MPRNLERDAFQVALIQEGAMKVSEAILKGYKTNGGRQIVNSRHDDGRMCVSGAFEMAMDGSPWVWGHDAEWSEFAHAFRAEYGVDPVELNNNDGRTPVPWEHIYGMAVAAGL